MNSNNHIINILLMSDNTTTLSSLKDEVKKFVEERKWTKYHTPKNLAQALNCEAGELSQLLLFKEYSPDEIKNDTELYQNISDELADVLIYLISFSNSLDIDISKAFIKKMNKNSKKYSIEEFNNGNYHKK